MQVHHVGILIVPSRRAGPADPHAFPFERALNLLKPCFVYPNGDKSQPAFSAASRRRNRLMTRELVKRSQLLPVITLLVWVWAACAASAKAQAPARFVGSITAITGNTVTVKTDTGDQRMFDVPAEAVLKRIAPGEKDLSKAATITFSELAVGDRVLVKIDTTATASTPQAAQIIAVKAEDLAQKQQKDREAWQRNGVAGLVKTINPADNVITLTTGAGAASKTVTVHLTKSTILKRYAPGSVRYEHAQVAPVDAIHPGDQLRARGQKSADGSEITADEIVSGSFRNIAGTISSVDPANSTMVVKDLASKKQVTVRISPEVQMRRLPEHMAQMLATRLKGGAPTGPGPNAPHETAAAGPPAGAPEAGPRRGNGGGPGGPAPMGPNGGGDPQQILNRAPAIQIGDLQKGEAVMLVSTEGASDVTAITLLAGVEPLLEAPAASQNLLSNWSMGSGSAEGAAGNP